MTTTKQMLLSQLDNFFTDLCNTFPQNTELNIFKEKFLLLKKANSAIIVQYFITYIYPFKQNIFNKELGRFVHSPAKQFFTELLLSKEKGTVVAFGKKWFLEK